MISARLDASLRVSFLLSLSSTVKAESSGASIRRLIHRPSFERVPAKRGESILRERELVHARRSTRTTLVQSRALPILLSRAKDIGEDEKEHAFGKRNFRLVRARLDSRMTETTIENGKTTVWKKKRKCLGLVDSPRFWRRILFGSLSATALPSASRRRKNGASSKLSQQPTN